MPRIFDNIEQNLIQALRETLGQSLRADFCVGYFNLRGWRLLNEPIGEWAGGEGACCRLLVGMNQTPQERIRTLYRGADLPQGIDNATALQEKGQRQKE